MIGGADRIGVCLRAISAAAAGERWWARNANELQHARVAGLVVTALWRVVMPVLVRLVLFLVILRIWLRSLPVFQWPAAQAGKTLRLVPPPGSCAARE